MKAIITVLLLAALGAGCRNALDVYESKAPTMIVSTNADGTISLASHDLSTEIMVTGTVRRVDLPFVNSPSLAGDKATCLLSVPAHSIPAHSDISKVALHYDNHGWLQGLSPGVVILLRFKTNGEFDGVQFPANFIQQNGAANGSQPIRSETNQTPSAAGSRR